MVSIKQKLFYWSKWFVICLSHFILIRVYNMIVYELLVIFMFIWAVTFRSGEVLLYDSVRHLSVNMALFCNQKYFGHTYFFWSRGQIHLSIWLSYHIFDIRGKLLASQKQSNGTLIWLCQQSPWPLFEGQVKIRNKPD